MTFETNKTKPIGPARDALRSLLLQPLIAIPFAIFFGTLFGASWKDYVLSYQMSLVFGLSILTCIWAIRHFVLPRLLEGEEQERRRLGWKIGLCFGVASLVGAYAASFIIHFTILPGFMGSLRAIVVSGMFTLLFSGLFMGFHFARVFYREAIDRARAVEQMRAELAQAELRALRAQVNPHFLFNTLNSIAALIVVNPAAAEDLTTRLADVFRYALRSSDREFARFGDELAFLRTYLDIERTRFQDRLRVVEAIEPGLDSLLVPSLLLQPVVENAVRHGISARPEGGTVRLAARRDGDRLEIEIADDGPGMGASDAPSGNGFGLHSVRERLRAAGLGQALEIDSAPGRGTRVRITIPVTLDPSDTTKGTST